MEVWRSVHPEVTLVALTNSEMVQVQTELRALLHMRQDCFATGRLLAHLDTIFRPISVGPV